MILFLLVIAALSAAPVPEWMRPLDFFQQEHPLESFFARILARPESVPRPSQGYVAGGGGGAAAEEDHFVDEEESAETRDELDTVIAGREHTSWQRPDRPHFDRFAPQLGLAAADLEIPCREEGSDGCHRYALDRFFARLAAAEARTEGGLTTVVHYGDSLIASDKITDMVRLRLQQRFGSGGRGFLLVRKFNAFQRGHRTGKGTGGWILDVITQAVLRDGFFGYTGASFTAQKAGEETVFEKLGRNRRVQISYLEQRGGGVLEVYADGELVSTFDTSTTKARRRAQVHEVTLPEGTSTLKLRAKTPGARVFGVILEAKTPGVVYESIGLPGATSKVWLVPDEEDFGRQLAQRAPSLVVTMLGGNDGLMLSKKRTSIEDVERDTRAFVQRIKAAVPEADCLMVSPLESVRAKVDGTMTPKPEVLEVKRVQQKIAAEERCAFWDMHTSMGGVGSLEKWVRAGLMLGDLIHPRNIGSDLLGEMMAEALMRGYDARMAELTAPRAPEAP